jgi:hypothetical protein
LSKDRFDVIYINGSHNSADVLADAAFSWPMIQDRGIIIFDDYEWTFFADAIDNPNSGWTPSYEYKTGNIVSRTDSIS